MFYRWNWAKYTSNFRILHSAKYTFP